MKIVFLCGSLEPGRDGVGDYTRKLAIELIRLGHQVSAISLSDEFVNEVSKAEQNTRRIDFPIRRLPSQLNKTERYRLAKDWIKECNPEWISLQFVIYSYDPKGLPFGLASLLKNLGTAGAKWHIMFHEIWIGIDDDASIKHKITGYLQKNIIKSVVKQLQPEVITTSNILYRLVLNGINVDATILSLFSNIDIAPKNEIFAAEILSKLNINDTSNRKDWEITGAFGQFHQNINLERMLNEQLDYSKAKNLKMAFIAFGRIGQAGIVEFERLKKKLSSNISFLYLGEQSRENVSNLLQLLNTGICFTQLQYVGKSGVFAAMKLHGINVIIPHDKTFPEYDAEIEKYQTEMINQDSGNWSVAHVSENLINLLANG